MAVSFEEGEIRDEVRFFGLQAYEKRASLGTKASRKDKGSFLAN